MQLGDILLGALIILALLGALALMNRKKDSSCCGSCSACSMHESCHKEDKK